VAGYVPDETPAELFDSACRYVLGQGGSDRIKPSWQSTGAWSREYFAVILPGDTLRLEWVYTDPAYRGRGISAQLIGRLLDTARERGVGGALLPISTRPLRGQLALTA
jgi:GNAT superfamily N-acetyltransferase